MSTITQWEGVFTHVDENGNKQQMFPEIKTDSTLTLGGKAADAAVTGAMIKKATPVKILKADFEALTEEQKNTGSYLITDAGLEFPEAGPVEPAGASSAAELSYDGSETGLGDNVQEAIDNLNGKSISSVNVTYDGSTTGLGNNVQEAIDAVFQLGTNRKSQIISSLKNSDLGFTEDTTWDEIFTGISNLFPFAYLYRNGNSCNDVTGGYATAGSYTAYSLNKNGRLYFKSQNKASNASGAYCYLHTVNPINILTEYKKLKIRIYSVSQYYGQVWIYIGTSKTGMSKSVKVIGYSSSSPSTSATNTEFEIDLSSITGKYYFGIALASGGETAEHATIYIDKVWIE